ncbi:hypothetical protein [Flagellimonas sp.]|uniref:hypothetical protein n=1 Tax=Flagellimonas sp. TaxID=2058762 RepID=UPI003B5050DE
MKKLFLPFAIALVFNTCLSQSTESDIQEIRIKYQKIEDSIPKAKKVILNRVFNNFPELWVLAYHGGYDVDLRDEVRHFTLDAEITVFYWKDKVKKVEITKWDWPDGNFFRKNEFYFDQDSIFFSYSENQSYNHFDNSKPLVSVTEERYYYKNDQIVRQLSKTFNARSNTQMKEKSLKIENEIVLDHSTENLQTGNELIKWLRSNGYLDLEGY